MTRLATVCGALILLFWTGVASAQVNTRVADAARVRDAQAVTALLKQGADANATLPDGATALHWAAHWNDLQMADALIAAGANVHAVNDYGVTPLVLAATNGSAAMIERLLKAGARANAALPTGETVLMTAARTGRTDAVIALLDHGADVNGSQASKGQTALMWAASEQHVDTVRALVARGADVNARTLGGFTPLMFAAREPSLDIVRVFVERGADVNESAPDGSTPLLIATVRGHVHIATYLLDRGAKADGNLAAAGYAPLHWASSKFEGVITFDYPDAPGEWSALAGIPSRSGQMELIKALLAHGAAVDARITKDPPRYGYHLFALGRGQLLRGATPFYMAALVADVEVMRLLLAAGADPQATTVNRSTPMMVAAGLAFQDNESRVPQSAYLAATRLMLDLGGDVRGGNEQGFTPLHAAAWAGFETVIQLLADRGAELNPRNDRDETPLDITEGYHANFYFDRPAAAALLRKLGAVGGVQRGGFLDGQTQKEYEEQLKSKPKQ